MIDLAVIVHSVNLLVSQVHVPTLSEYNGIVCNLYISERRNEIYLRCKGNGFFFWILFVFLCFVCLVNEYLFIIVFLAK